MFSTKKLIRILLIPITFNLLVSCGADVGDTTRNNTAEPLVKTTITLTTLPDSFIYDFDTSQNGSSEYMWRISFDINNDSIINEGDIFFSIDLVAFDATSQRTINLSDLQAYIWIYGDGVTYISRRDVEINLTSTNTSLIFTAPVSLNSSLASISSGTQVFAETLYRDQTSGTYYYDYFPGKNAYTIGLDTSLLIDSKLDFETNIGPVSGKNYPLIDIESISVTIE